MKPRRSKEELKQGMYYIFATPRKLKPGWTLAHNHMRHTIHMACGRNGFRAWWYTNGVPQYFKPCGCGWSGLPHVSTTPEYKCEAEKVIASFD
jgi:hypothetical protein